MLSSPKRVRYLGPFFQRIPRGPAVGKLRANAQWREKTSFASNASGGFSGQARTHDWCSKGRIQGQDPRRARPHGPARQSCPIRPSTECASSSRCQISSGRGPSGSAAQLPASWIKKRRGLRRSRPIRATKLIIIASDTFFQDQVTRNWWSQTGSNRRPHACKARALPTELWPLLKAVGSGRSAVAEPCEPAGSSDCPRPHCRLPKLVGLGGLEPPTSRLSSARSNQLSYKPGRRLFVTPRSKPKGPKTARVFPNPNVSERETKAARSRQCGL